ncbi:MAG TPA: diacylglycerol kinase family protein [Candidatus Sulfotelmatobacter sp.]|jgi:diacylglycerol kinase family enzyme
MRKAALLYNPDSGGRRRQAELESALSIFRGGGVEADLLPTNSPQHAEDEARRAIALGADTIFACGGDGTIHNIIQVLAGTQVALGVLPMGTANALAHDLGVPMRIPAAARSALKARSRRIPLGFITYLDLNGLESARYFIVAAGMGVDAHLFYKLHAGIKKRLGMSAYYAKAWQLWFSYPMTRFRVRYLDLSGVMNEANATELMAVRIRHFGGVIQELAPGASLDRDDLRLVLCRTASRIAYLAYVTRGFLRRRWRVPGIELAYSRHASCEYLDASEEQRKVYVEADGELVGTLPAKIKVVPDALTVLAPPDRATGN